VIAFCEGKYAMRPSALRRCATSLRASAGSHAQRDILTLTLIEAARRVGQSRLAQHFASERVVHKPAGRWGRALYGIASAADALSGVDWHEAVVGGGRGAEGSRRRSRFGPSSRRSR
jgi:hypothetical protein